MTDPELTIVILSYNVEKLLLNCLASLKAARRPSDKWRTIVVDNNSTDNSVSSVKTAFPDVTVMENTQNLGFAAGNNVALKKITSEYTLLLNPDTLVFPQTIQTVLQFLKTHPEYAAATCRVELPDGSLDYSCHRGFPNPWNSFIYFFTGLNRLFPGIKPFSGYARSDKIFTTTHEIDALTGAFALVRTTVGQSIGWLDEDFYWNGEDLDFCYRLKQAGWKIAFIPEVKITHFKGSSSGLYRNSSSNPVERSVRVRTVKAATSAMRVFYSKHYAHKFISPFNWFVYLGIHLLRTIRLIKVYLSA